MENHHSYYQEDPAWLVSISLRSGSGQIVILMKRLHRSPPETSNPGQIHTPGGLQSYPADGFYPPTQTIPMPMPLPSQLVNLDPYNTPSGIQGSFQRYSGQDFTNPGPSETMETMATKKDLHIQPYDEYARGSTIGDPVSVEDDKGRVWQNYKPDKYFLPNDAIEQDRLDFNHKGFCIQLHKMQDPRTRSENSDDALHLAPIKGDPPRVLDFGTGTGKSPVHKREVETNLIS